MYEENVEGADRDHIFNALGVNKKTTPALKALKALDEKLFFFTVCYVPCQRGPYPFTTPHSLPSHFFLLRLLPHYYTSTVKDRDDNGYPRPDTQ